MAHKIHTRKTPHTTREAWLVAAAKGMLPMFTKHGYPVEAKFRVSAGLPSKRALANKNRSIGECWSPSSTRDNVAEIFISPTVEKPMDVMAILAHEMGHAATPGVGHKAPFPRLMLLLGLEGKPTHTHAGPAFEKAVAPILAKLGPYPQGALSGTGPTRKQGTRMIKMECPECGYIARTTRQWLDLYGPTICPEHNEHMTVEGDDA